MRILRNITGREGSGLGREKRPPPPIWGRARPTTVSQRQLRAEPRGAPPQGALPALFSRAFFGWDWSTAPSQVPPGRVETRRPSPAPSPRALRTTLRTAAASRCSDTARPSVHPSRLAAATPGAPAGATHFLGYRIFFFGICRSFKVGAVVARRRPARAGVRGVRGPASAPAVPPPPCQPPPRTALKNSWNAARSPAPFWVSTAHSPRTPVSVLGRSPPPALPPERPPPRGRLRSSSVRRRPWAPASAASRAAHRRRKWALRAAPPPGPPMLEAVPTASTGTFRPQARPQKRPPTSPAGTNSALEASSTAQRRWAAAGRGSAAARTSTTPATRR